MEPLQMMASVYPVTTGAEAASSILNLKSVVAVENDQVGILPAGHERYPTVAFMRRVNNQSLFCDKDWQVLSSTWLPVGRKTCFDRDTPD